MRNDNLPELLPCPFCGDADVAIFHNTSSDHMYDWDYHVECKSCGSSGSCDTQKLQAAIEWNRRDAVAVRGVTDDHWRPLYEAMKVAHDSEIALRGVRDRLGDAVAAASGAGVWHPIENVPKDMASRLYRVGRFCVQGFVDATGELMVQSEVPPHWRNMRGKPTHWMPIPDTPLAAAPTHDSDGGAATDWLLIARKHGYAFPDKRMQAFIADLISAKLAR